MAQPPRRPPPRLPAQQRAPARPPVQQRAPAATRPPARPPAQQRVAPPPARQRPAAPPARPAPATRPAARPGGRPTARGGGRASSSGYVYRPRSPEDIKRHGERKGGQYDSIFKSGADVWRPKVGDNVFRYCPPTWDGYDHYGYKVFVHKYIGADESTYLCLRKMLNQNCPICNAEQDARAAGEKDEAKALGVKEDFVYWIINREGDDTDHPLLAQNSWMMDRDVVSLCYDKRNGKALYIDHHEKGYDVTFKREGTSVRTRYFGFAIDREPSPLHQDPATQEAIMQYIIANPVPSMLNYYDEQHLEQVLSGASAVQDAELDGEQGEGEYDESAVPEEEYVEEAGEEYAEEGGAEGAEEYVEEGAEEYAEEGGEAYGEEGAEEYVEEGAEEGGEEYVEEAADEPEPPPPPPRRAPPGRTQRPTQQSRGAPGRAPAPAPATRSGRAPVQTRPAGRPAPAPRGGGGTRYNR